MHIDVGGCVSAVADFILRTNAVGRVLASGTKYLPISCTIESLYSHEKFAIAFDLLNRSCRRTGADDYPPITSLLCGIFGSDALNSRSAGFGLCDMPVARRTTSRPAFRSGRAQTRSAG